MVPDLNGKFDISFYTSAAYIIIIIIIVIIIIIIIIQAESMVPDLDGKFDISLYTSAAYIIIVVAAIVSIVAFFGCFGAVKVLKSIILPIIFHFDLRRVNACLAPTLFSSLQHSL